MWTQKRFQLPAQKRGFHLVTKEIENELPQIRSISKGLLHLFIQHTSASLSINENADPSVRRDMEAYFTRNVKENEPYYEHTLEGPDDMPAHIKSVILGCELTLPICNGALALGTWQGIYLGEHRNYGGPRTIIATIQGE